MADLPLVLTRFPSARQAGGSSGELVSTSISAFAASLVERRVGAKDGSGFCAAEFVKTDGKIARFADALVSRTMFFLDVEKNKLTGERPPPFEDAIKLIKAKWPNGIWAVGWTTHNHWPGEPRYRLGFFIDEPIAIPAKGTEERRLHDKIDARATRLIARKLDLEGVIDGTKLGPASLFYMPSAESEAALVDHAAVTIEGRPLLTSGLMEKARVEIELEEAQQASRAAEALTVAQAREAGRAKLGLGRHGDAPGDGVIEALRPLLPSLGSILRDHGYKPVGERWLAPGSTSGMAGVVILKGEDGRERTFSHHSPASDPLSDGHAHDALDLLTTLRFGGDLIAALRTLAREHGVERCRDRMNGTEDLAEGTANKNERGEGGGSGASRSGHRFVLERWPDIHFAPEEAFWLVDELLPLHGLATLYGPPKTYKSFIAFDVALAVARGRPWAGRKVVGGPVVYLAGEGAHGLRKRVEGYRIHHGLAGVDLPFNLIAARPNLGRAHGDAPALIAAIKAQIGETMPALIVVDTLAQTLGDAEENGVGMQAFITNAGVIAEMFDCLVGVVHHTGKNLDAGLRGHSSLLGAVDASLRVKKTGPLKAVLSVEASKDAEDGLDFEVDLKVVSLGTSGMKEITTLTVDDVTEAGRTVKAGGRSARRPSASLRALMTAQANAAIEYGEMMRPQLDMPPTRVVDLERVRDEYYRLRGDEVAESSKRKAFSRSVRAAVDAEVLYSRVIGGRPFIWRLDEPPV